MNPLNKRTSGSGSLEFERIQAPKRLRQDEVSLIAQKSLLSRGFSSIDQVRTYLEITGRYLEVLNLKGFQVNDEEFFACIRLCPNIRSLSVSSRKLSDQAIVRASALENQLTSLNLSRCSKLGSESVRAICAHLPHLTSLNLSLIRPLTSDDVCAIAKNLRELRKLCLSYDLGYYFVKNTDILTILHFLPKLTYLDLSGWAEITDHYVAAICRGLRGVKALLLNDCDRLTDKSAKAIAQRLPGLKKLGLRSVTPISKSGFEELFRSLKKLRWLHVEECDVNGESIQMLANRCNQLKKLYLGKTILNQAVDLQPLSQFPQLKLLDLFRVQVDVDMLKNIVSHLPMLEWIDLEGHQELTFDDAFIILSRLPNLTWLGLKECPLFTSEEIRELEVEFPRVYFES